MTSPEQVDARLVRHYLAELATKGKSDKTLHAHARAIRTLVRFWYAEKYIPAPVTFAMPRMENKRHPCLSAEQLNSTLSACKNPRDKALLLFMADSGLRRAEIIALNWGDVDMMSGLVRVKRGKGGKARSAVIGATTCRVLLADRRTLENLIDNSPLFQSRTGERFTGTGVLLKFRRLSKKTGIHVTPHALRRTFVILFARRDGCTPITSHAWTWFSITPKWLTMICSRPIRRIHPSIICHNSEKNNLCVLATTAWDLGISSAPLPRL